MENFEKIIYDRFVGKTVKVDCFSFWLNGKKIKPYEVVDLSDGIKRYVGDALFLSHSYYPHTEEQVIKHVQFYRFERGMTSISHHFEITLFSDFKNIGTICMIVGRCNAGQTFSFDLGFINITLNDVGIPISVS